MDWQSLFKMQRQLDFYIEKQHGLEDEPLFEKKVMALLVEVGELANETRCFKFWSLKPPSDRSVIAEEYVDGIHFILSLGLEIGVENVNLEGQNSTENLTTLFHDVFEAIHHFKLTKQVDTYEQLFSTYLTLGNKLGFLANDIQEAYLKKNKINFERQEQGY
ncbi:dimeric dUTPase (all-alpha-NTP-PPase superfamily) [Gracilibacillus halotolerans]|uniref:Dimeric dUTPase (All-alpha-NTP-PPase superfamily) n=1 Tax=Gracilibacillus halotolerans TaxID=74386 RepID=A0A841RI57_9BACI|nr:dUTP diphosphatase [Gracilibacillus halotolerans]MBB6513880.1 dimeric dUTPase (all-alpha-NTP-PPase superfamily) [Gracilibacillus halotolerans]